MILKTNFLKFIVLLVIVLGLSACASTPRGGPTTPTLEQAQGYYQQGQYKEALYDLNYLAVKGDREAMYALGYMYHYGLGVKANPDLARGWFHQAYTKGLSKAKKALDSMDRPIFPSKENLIPAAELLQNSDIEQAAEPVAVVEAVKAVSANQTHEKALAVRVASFTALKNANRLNDDLTAKGLDAYQFTALNSNGVEITQVLVGPLKARNEAEDLIKSLQQETGLEGLVVRYADTI
ncbi:MAG: SPOR domain-containing protein [Gammaproteobacteria bacterium]